MHILPLQNAVPVTFSSTTGWSRTHARRGGWERSVKWVVAPMRVGEVGNPATIAPMHVGEVGDQTDYVAPTRVGEVGIPGPT